MRILLFGADGQLGGYLKTGLAAHGEVQAFDRAELDFTDSARLREQVLAARPRVIVNAAAYTAVDRAESEQELAWAVNAAAPGVLAQAARACGALVFHYSTDYVFDGAARTPYREDAPVHPLGVYGRSKFAGEEMVRASGAAHLILRTAWLYSNRGHNFLKTMLRLAGERDELRVVNDQIGCPTYAAAVAAASAAMLTVMLPGGEPRPALSGTYHVACRGETSWYGFAERIVALAGLSGRVRVTPIPTSAYPTPAQRPSYSVLSGEKLKRAFGIELPEWPDGLRQCLADGGLLG